MPDPVYLPQPPGPLESLPFSEAVRLGDVLYMSGQIGTLPGSLRLVEGGIEAEARQCMENMKSALERAGSELERAVKFTVFLADMDEWPAFNGVYVQFFGPNKPARSAFAAAGIALGARVELECIAAAGPGTPS